MDPDHSIQEGMESGHTNLYMYMYMYTVHAMCWYGTCTMCLHGLFNSLVLADGRTCTCTYSKCKSPLHAWEFKVTKHSRGVLVFPLHSQLHSLSEDGCLISCTVCDPPVLLYVKKQMDEGTLLDTYTCTCTCKCMYTHNTHVQ